MKPVSVITVHFNQPDLTEALLRSIIRCNQYPHVEVIVVDNGSVENHCPRWQTEYPDMKFIRSEINLGFAGGNNLGLLHATGDYLFLINNDTEVTPELIGTLVQTMEDDPSIGVTSPKIRYFDQPEVLQYAGYTPMNFYTCRNACIGQFEPDQGQYDQYGGTTGYAHGAAMMLRREAIMKAGPMAENYFLYYEEMDWCERIRKAGYKIHINTRAVIYHKESMSVGKMSTLKEYFMNRNRILFVRRNATPVKCMIFYCYFLGVVMPRNLIQYVKGKNYHFIPVLLKAVWWNVTHRKNSSDLGYQLK